MEPCEGQIVMDTVNPEVQALFDCYKDLIGSPSLQMNMYYEALIFEATRMGLTPSMLTAVFHARKKALREGKPAKGTFIRHLFGLEATGDLLDEYANLEGQRRVRVMDPARQEVLRATHRPTDLPETPAKASKEVIAKLAEGWSEVKKAIEQ